MTKTLQLQIPVRLPFRRTFEIDGATVKIRHLTLSVTHPMLDIVDHLLEEIPRLMLDGMYEGSPRGTTKYRDWP